MSAPHVPCQCWGDMARAWLHDGPCCFADDPRPVADIPPGGPLACGCDGSHR